MLWFAKNAAPRRGPGPAGNRSRLSGVIVCAIVASVIVVSGCSATRLLYENLDWIAYQALDERFDIRADQAEAVESRLHALHGWHRETQLPLYRQTLQATAVRFADGLDLADLHWLEQRIEQHRLALAERLIPDLAGFLADLDPEQVARYENVSAEGLAEAAEPLALEDEARTARRLDAYLERIEPWTGSLTGRQRDALTARVADQPDLRPAWLALRQARRDALLAELRRERGARPIADLLRGWWLDLETGYPRDYAVARRASLEHLYETLVDLDGRLEPGQRERVLERLADYRSAVETVLAARD